MFPTSKETPPSMEAFNLREKMAAVGADDEKWPLDATDPRHTAEQFESWLAEIDSLLGDIRTEFGAAKSSETVKIADLVQLMNRRTALAAIRDEIAAIGAERIEAARAEVIRQMEESFNGADAGEAENVDNTVAEVTENDPELVAAANSADTKIIGVGVKVSGKADGDLPVQPETEKFVAASSGGVALREFTTSVATSRSGVRRVPLGIPDLQRQIATAAKSLGGAEKVVVASAPGFAEFEGVEYVDRSKSADENTAIIERYLDRHRARLSGDKAKMAAAPWCGPFDPVRQLKDCGTDEAPIFESLPFVPMGYGGFRFNTDYSLSTAFGAVDVWTQADQSAIDPADPSSWKRCLTIDCAGDGTLVELTEWLTACAEWQVNLERGNPERFDKALRLVRRAFIRLREQYLRALLNSLTVNYTNLVPQYLEIGGVVGLVNKIAAEMQDAVYDERVAYEAGYTVYLDTSTISQLGIIERNSVTAVTDGSPASIVRYITEQLPFVSRVVEVHDRVPGGYGALTANGNPRGPLPAPGSAPVAAPTGITQHEILVIPTADVFAFGTGETNTGVMQDFSMARQNRVGWFMEEQIAIARYGCNPWFRNFVCLGGHTKRYGAINFNVDGVDAAPNTACAAPTWPQTPGPDPNP